MKQFSTTPMRLALAAVLVSVLAAAPAVRADNDDDQGDDARVFKAKLTGYEEVPAQNNTATGSFRATLNSSGSMLTFQFSYSGLTGNPTAAHVHFGQKGVNGGVMFFMCGGGGKPACPASTSGSISGTVVAADVIGPMAQGISPGDFAAVIKAMRAGISYANIHTAINPGGESRGQVKVDD